MGSCTRHLIAYGLAAAALALPTTASADPAGDSFVVEEQGAHSPSAAYGNGGYLRSSSSATAMRPSAGWARAESPVRPPGCIRARAARWPSTRAATSGSS